jgi:hypothetical protein
LRPTSAIFPKKPELIYSSVTAKNDSSVGFLAAQKMHKVALHLHFQASLNHGASACSHVWAISKLCVHTFYSVNRFFLMHTFQTVAFESEDSSSFFGACSLLFAQNG